MAIVMNIDDPRWPLFHTEEDNGGFSPAPGPVEGFHMVPLVTPEGFVDYYDDFPDFMHEIIAWLGDPSLKGEYVFLQDYLTGPGWFRPKKGHKKEVRIKYIIAYFDDPDTAFHFKIRWG